MVQSKTLFRFHQFFLHSDISVCTYTVWVCDCVVLCNFITQDSCDYHHNQNRDCSSLVFNVIYFRSFYFKDMTIYVNRITYGLYMALTLAFTICQRPCNSFSNTNTFIQFRSLQSRYYYPYFTDEDIDVCIIKICEILIP